MFNDPRLLKDCNSGVAMIEYALAVPFLLTALFGTLEFVNFAIINEKIGKAANAMGDFAGMSTSNLSTAAATTYANAVPQIFQPFTFNGTVIFTQVSSFSQPISPCPGAAPTNCIMFQNTPVGSDPSQLPGSLYQTTTLPSGYTVLPDQNIVAAEIFYNYSPILDITGTLIPTLSSQKLYKIAIYKSRTPQLPSPPVPALPPWPAPAPLPPAPGPGGPPLPPPPPPPG